MKKKKLTAKMIKAYIENSNKCPFCESGSISYTSNYELPTGAQVECEDCESRWWEVFEIKTIEVFD